jgi:hypothetical protein
MIEPIDRATNSRLIRLMGIEDVELLDEIVMAADEYMTRLYGAGEREEGTKFTPDETSLPPWLDLSWDAIELTPGEHRYIFNVFKHWRYMEDSDGG